MKFDTYMIDAARKIAKAAAVNENAQITTRRFNPVKLNVLMEKLLPELTKSQAKKLVEIYADICAMATALNMTQYTKFNMSEWVILKTATAVKLTEMKDEAQKISSKKKDIDFRPLIKALEEAVTY